MYVLSARAQDEVGLNGKLEAELSDGKKGKDLRSWLRGCRSVGVYREGQDNGRCVKVGALFILHILHGESCFYSGKSDVIYKLS
ncbi:hypothetical protein D3C84_586690 [compost metagenome]